MKILIVDDHRTQYNRFVANLRKEHPDVEIRYAISAVEALEIFKSLKFDLIVLDQVMGGGEKDGTAFLNKLRDYSTGELPQIIFVTGHYDQIPTTELLSIDVPITLFLEKDRSFQETLLVATQLVMRRIDRTIRYDPKDLFGDAFSSLILQEANEILKKEHGGYYGITQQRQIGTLVRSYINSLNMRSEWDVDDVLELSIFFAQSMCKVFRVPEEMIGILRRFLSIEEILYTIPHYRDHFFHQIKVFFLGFCIINVLNRNECLRGSVLEDKNGLKIWFMTSIFHDIGYPFEKMRGWLDAFIEGVLRSPGDKKNSNKTIIPIEFHWGFLLGRRFHSYHLERVVKRICQLYGKDTPDVVAELLSEMAALVVESPDHGLYSSLIVQNFLRYNLNDNEVDPVALAIALHNDQVSRLVKRVVGPQSFDKDPISFLLAYCDLAQDWGRIRPLGMGKYGYGNLGYPVFVAKDIFEPESNMIRVTLRYKRQMTLQEQREWHENIYEKYIEPTRSCWAASSSSRPRVNFCIDYQIPSDDDKILAQLRF
ncbi:MAG: response regulator [Proteobacteria bacterium]|nr:response regulator [Pseudomonadota bacterium]